MATSWWIESHVALGSHPKTKRLARRLGVELPHALGCLHLLWYWAVTYAEDGDLSRYAADELADAGGWGGEPDAFLDALVDAGFVDRSKNELALHDWMEHGGRVLQARRKQQEGGRRGAQKRWGSTTRADGEPSSPPNGEPNGHPNGVSMGSDSTRQDLTRENNTTPKPLQAGGEKKLRSELAAKGHSPEWIDFGLRAVAESKDPVMRPLAYAHRAIVNEQTFHAEQQAEKQRRAEGSAKAQAVIDACGLCDRNGKVFDDASNVGYDCSHAIEVKAAVSA